MKKICSWLSALLLLAALAIPAGAYEIPADLEHKTLEEVMDAYRADRGLNEQNFSMSYYDPASGERYTYEDTHFMVAASTFKLPLNMYYYEMEQAGEIAPDAFIPGAGTTLDQAHEQSLVHSNNEVSIGMLYNLGDFRTYKKCMMKYFTMPEEEIDPIYFADNYYCTHMMMDALEYLYAHSEDFSEMLGYMKQAQPDQYFRAGVQEFEVAHKYGWYDGAVNDVGIIYTPQPFLLAVYTQGVYETVVGEVAELVTAWHEAQPAEQPEPEPAEPPKGDPIHLEIQTVPKEPAPEPEPVPEPEPAEPEPVQPEPEEPESAFEWWMVAVALGVFLFGGGLTLLIIRPSRLHKRFREEEESGEDEE